MNVLVTGFGSFPGVDENPTEALARAVDGTELDGARVYGRVLPVSFARGPDEAIEAARALDAGLVIGLGVAVDRPSVCVERVGRMCVARSADVDGSLEAGLMGPELVWSTVDVAALCGALGAVPSEDAGAYVCNAWLYRVTEALAPVPVGFVHVPTEGLAPGRLCAALQALVRGIESAL